MSPGYEQWTHDQLVARIRDLESQLQPDNGSKAENAVEASAATATLATSSNGEQEIPFRKPPKQLPKAFDASRYTTRLIALKFAYLGQKYNGLEHHTNNKTPLPTIEEELWKALMKTRLISPTPRGEEVVDKYKRLDRKTFDRWDRDGADVNWEGCEYSKCGRTDRGVSAFGQVIGIRVRSNRPRPKPEPIVRSENAEETISAAEEDSLTVEEDVQDEKPFDELRDELPYIQLLNKVLPPDIRIYAWCPNPPPDFSARFSCKERRYKYFFTNPCFAPVPGTSGLYSSPSSASDEPSMREGWLDIAAMREACKRLEGLRDFRNFCKIDASKQITNFHRRIFHASIEAVSPLSMPLFLSHPAMQNPASGEQPQMYAFVLHGSAFLWHQVRSIVAILFLIGQRLEDPSLITEMMDIEKNPTRPKYEMASDAPLVLWDCIFPAASEIQDSDTRDHGYVDALPWVYVGDPGAIEPSTYKPGKAGGLSTVGRGKWGKGGVMDDVWELWRGNKVDETLSALLMDAIAERGTSTLNGQEQVEGNGMPKGGPRVFDGGNVGRAKGVYTPVLDRERQEPVEVVNERYAKKKGLDANGRRPKPEGADE